MENKIFRRNKFATATSHDSGMKSMKKNGNGSNRDALAELTNSLIPPEVLLDLCSNSTSASKAQDLPLRSKSSVFPVSKNLQNLKSNSKSDTNIGLSTFKNVRDARTPTPVRHQLSNSSSANLGNEPEKLAVYGRRWTLENVDRPRKIDSKLVSSTPVKQKMKEDGKVISVHLSTKPSYKAKNKLKAVDVPPDLIQSEKKRAKEKGFAVSLSSASVEKLNDKVKVTVGSRNSTPVEKPKDKGKEIAMPLSSSSTEKVKNKGKEVVVPFRHLIEQAEHKEKSTAMLNNRPLNKKVRRNGKGAISSCPPLWRRRGMRDKLNEADDIKPSKAWSDPHPKKKKRRCSEQQTVSDYSLSQEFENQKAYFQEIDAFELPVEEVSSSDLD